MSVRLIGLSLTIASLLIHAGCGMNPPPVSGSAAIVGSIVPAGPSGKFMANAQLVCPTVVVTLNNNVVNFELDDDCNFLVDDVQPAALVSLRVELKDLGISGTIELANVGEAELIEVLVETSEDSLSISVVRRAVPDSTDQLPEFVSGNNVTIFISAGVFDQSLTVDGNNFTLVGKAGDGCGAAGWSVITGDVLILGNNATFRNIRFEGRVEIAGNNARFINTCLGSELVIFGNNAEFDDDDGDDDDGGDDDEGDDEDD